MSSKMIDGGRGTVSRYGNMRSNVSKHLVKWLCNECGMVDGKFAAAELTGAMSLAEAALKEHWKSCEAD